MDSAHRDSARLEPTATRNGREVVPDVLRAVAIVAMLIAHAAPAWGSMPGIVRTLTGNVSNLASPLFALVMGISAQLLLMRTPPRRRGVATLQQAARGVVLIALGVWMQTWGTWVVIVLQYLGVLLIVGVPLVLLATRWVAVAAAAMFLLSDPVNAWARGHVSPVGVWSEPMQWVVLGSSYRLTNLLPFFLLGILLARHGFRRDRATWAMLAIAPVPYLVRPLGERLLGWPDAVSGSYPDTLHDVGLVFAASGVVLLLAGVRTEPWQRVVRVSFSFLASVGQLALSLYLLHIGVLWLWSAVGWHRYPDDPLLWGAVVVGTLAVGWLWWRFVGTGPVEWLMGAVTGRRRPLRGR
ncbi:MAG: heparan-alpha-glucosaminide N-acetyltransferase domain-containing protein [Microbacterium sp.]